MDMTKLTQEHHELVRHLEEIGYSPDVVQLAEIRFTERWA